MCLGWPLVNHIMVIIAENKLCDQQKFMFLRLLVFS